MPSERSFGSRSPWRPSKLAVPRVDQYHVCGLSVAASTNTAVTVALPDNRMDNFLDRDASSAVCLALRSLQAQ